MSQTIRTDSVSAPGFFGLKAVPAEHVFNCSQCKQQKPCNDFPKATTKKRGFAPICKKCKAQNLAKKKASMSPDDWLLLNRKYWLKSQYNLSLADYNEKLVAQNHKCAICACDETEAYKSLLFVDHCHTTKKIRGLLCHHCNTALGKFRDSPEILAKAIQYLESQ
jgi:hypothetical protein